MDILKVNYEVPLPKEEVYLDKKGLEANLRGFGISLTAV